MEEKTIFSEMWDAYRTTVLHSIVTSFGLDFLVHDQHGGDVDTILGVRESGNYKNNRNAADYENRGEYDTVAYHHNDAYNGTIRIAKEAQEFIEDAYVPGNRVYYGKASALGTEELRPGFNRRANLDHVISAKEIQDDRGRVLAGLDGTVLANQPSNLRFTNERLNKSMKDMTIDEYIQWRDSHGDPLPVDVQERMLAEDENARKEYNRHIVKAYYSSDKFLIDAGIAATKRGLEMGTRQALGFVFVEVWCACEDELKALPTGVAFIDCMQAVESGIKKGFGNAQLKYKDLLSQFGQGFSAGALASLTTTLINIFLTTDKNTVRYIRQGCTTVVQVGNILLNNPQDLLLGDQIKSATVCLATGASIIAGTAVGNQIGKTQLGQNEEFGSILQNFCSSLVSGLISCTLLIMIDRSQLISDIITQMNHYGSIDHSIRDTSDAFIRLAAEVSQCDITELKGDVLVLDECARMITSTDDEELDHILQTAVDKLNIALPWQGDFDSFMDDPDTCLVFE